MTGILKPTRKDITDLYIRVCRDSSFAMGHVQAAQLTTAVLKIHPLDILIACGDFDNLVKISTGEHPTCKKEPQA